MTNLTERQSAIFKFLVLYIEKNGYPPTRQEIADAFEFSSVNGAQCHLKAIAAKGYIRILGGGGRAITILKAA